MKAAAEGPLKGILALHQGQGGLHRLPGRELHLRLRRRRQHHAGSHLPEGWWPGTTTNGATPARCWRWSKVSGQVATQAEHGSRRSHCRRCFRRGGMHAGRHQRAGADRAPGAAADPGHAGPGAGRPSTTWPSPPCAGPPGQVRQRPRPGGLPVGHGEGCLVLDGRRVPLFREADPGPGAVRGPRARRWCWNAPGASPGGSWRPGTCGTAWPGWCHRPVRRTRT